MKGLRVTKIVKGNKFWRGLSRVRSKKLFPETINHKIFETNSREIVHYRKSLSSVFEEIFPIFASINNIFILARGMGTRLLFYEFLKTFLISHNSWNLKSEVVRQLIYTMFISNNCESFHLRWKENLVK